MALQDAILTITEAMDADAKSMGAGTEQARVMGYAFALRCAVKAAEGQQPSINPITSLVLGSTPEAASLQNATMIEQARDEFRKGRRKADVQEQLEPRMVLAVGGEEDGTMVPCDPQMPVGARCLLGSQTYELKADGNLHHCDK